MSLEIFLPLLAVLGFGALLFHAARALLRLGLVAAERAALSGMIEVSLRRGDLTGLAERRAQVASLRAARRRTAAVALLWLALIAVPPALGLAQQAYALAALLWLLPRRPIRRASPDDPRTLEPVA